MIIVIAIIVALSAIIARKIHEENIHNEYS